jgi:hypothetical protein
VIQLLNEKIARIQQDVENMAADFQNKRTGDGKPDLAARFASVANAAIMALQVGITVVNVLQGIGDFLSSVPLPPTPLTPRKLTLLHHFHKPLMLCPPWSVIFIQSQCYDIRHREKRDLYIIIIRVSIRARPTMGNRQKQA